jgi:hypothetical protein
LGRLLVAPPDEGSKARCRQYGLLDHRIRVLLEEAQQPASRNALKSVRVLPREQEGELE